MIRRSMADSYDREDYDLLKRAAKAYASEREYGERIHGSVYDGFPIEDIKSYLYERDYDYSYKPPRTVVDSPKPEKTQGSSAPKSPKRSSESPAQGSCQRCKAVVAAGKRHCVACQRSVVFINKAKRK